MSTTKLPFKERQYSSNVGGKTELNNDQINSQIHSLQTNDAEINKPIRKKKTHNVYNDSLEQVINSGNQYNDDKLDYLDEHRKLYVNEHGPEVLYDPAIELEKKRGSIQNNVVRFFDYYINVDSRNRQLTKNYILNKTNKLNDNPFKLEKGNSLIYISHPHNNFSNNDKITINGFSAIVNNFIYEPLVPLKNIIIFKEGLDYVLIKQKHDISETSQDTFYCSISDFTNPPSNLYFGNIPITFINGTHEIILSIGEGIYFNDGQNNIEAVFNPLYFYIKLPYAYKTGSVEDGTALSNKARSLTLTLYYIYNIPIYLFNAGYPTTIYRSNEYYTIANVTDDGYYINVEATAYWEDNDIYKNIGGNNIYVNRIKTIINDYSNPNSYSIKLNNSYKNIVKVELISSEFPNVENNVYKRLNENYDSSDNKSLQYFQNNKLYWQNYADGNYTYNVEIPIGIYDEKTLATAIHDTIYNVPRIYYDTQLQRDQPYTNHNYIDVVIDENTNLTSFTSYTEYILKHALKGLFYIRYLDDGSKMFVQIKDKDNLPNNEQDPQYNHSYPLFLIVRFEEHNLVLNNQFIKTTNETLISGNKIELENVISYMGIPSEYINQEFEVYQIPEKLYESNYDTDPVNYNEISITYLNTDYFMVQLPEVDIDYFIQDNTNDGGVFRCYLPNIFRLLFNQSDTLGEVLGFNNIGNTTSITKWDSLITNHDLYEPDIGITIGTELVNNTAINLKGHNYILIICEQLQIMQVNLPSIKSAFAKILLKKPLGEVCYNTFINASHIFFTPINELNELTFKFYNPDGLLYDFNNLNHSFMIKLTIIDKSQLRTNISSYTGTQI